LVPLAKNIIYFVDQPAEWGLHHCDRPSKNNYYSGYLVYWFSGKPNFWVRASIITEVIVTPVLLASTAQ
jgi:hypothetical protein